MAKTIQQSVTFSASPEALYDIYMDSKKHGAAVGSKASVSRKVGGRFSVFGGGVSGKNLAVVPNRTVVQTWRGNTWKSTDPDSILILTFSRAPGGGRIDLVHANVPDHDQAGIKSGWHKYYWRPWKAYLRKNSGRR